MTRAEDVRERITFLAAGAAEGAAHAAVRTTLHGRHRAVYFAQYNFWRAADTYEAATWREVRSD